MIRARTVLTALAGFGAMLALATGIDAQGPGAATPPAQTAPAANRPVIAVFNMVAVMKEYKKAKYQVYLLSEAKKKEFVEINADKAEYLKLQQDIKLQIDPRVQDANQKRMVELARRIEDRTHDIDKKLNEQATGVISSLYDEIKTVVDKTAEMNGYHIVFAYPDAASAEEAKSAYMKELKLKPPAAQPFYVARHVDITGVVIQTLNTWYPSPDPPTTTPPQSQNTQPPQPAQPPRPGAPGRP